MGRDLKKRNIEPEFSHLFSIEDMQGTNEKISLEADGEARQALIRRLDVVSVEKLTADLTIEKQGFVYVVSGVLHADIVQNCRVTAESVDVHIEGDVEGFFAEKTETISFVKAKRDKILENQDPEVPFLDEQDDPEAILDGKIDLGELVTQFLSLSIDPYFQKEGAAHPLGDDDEEAVRQATRPPNPFAKLEAMKKVLEEKE